MIDLEKHQNVDGFLMPIFKERAFRKDFHFAKEGKLVIEK